MSAVRWEEQDITYSLGFIEAYRGSRGRVYSGVEPDRGWVWELAQSWPMATEERGEVYDEASRNQKTLIASPSVFETITDAMEDVERVLRILEPDAGRNCPINHALLSFKTWGP